MSIAGDLQWPAGLAGVGSVGVGEREEGFLEVAAGDLDLADGAAKVVESPDGGVRLGRGEYDVVVVDGDVGDAGKPATRRCPGSSPPPC